METPNAYEQLAPVVASILPAIDAMLHSVQRNRDRKIIAWGSAQFGQALCETIQDVPRGAMIVFSVRYLENELPAVALSDRFKPRTPLARDLMGKISRLAALDENIRDRYSRADFQRQLLRILDALTDAVFKMDRWCPKPYQGVAMLLCFTDLLNENL